jgi:hypothetical protein
MNKHAASYASLLEIADEGLRILSMVLKGITIIIKSQLAFMDYLYYNHP